MCRAVSLHTAPREDNVLRAKTVPGMCRTLSVGYLQFRTLFFHTGKKFPLGGGAT